MKNILPFLAFFLFYAELAYSYTTWRTNDEQLTMYFGKPDAPLKQAAFTETDKAQTFHVTVQNTSDASMSLELTFRTIETVEFPEAEPTEPDTLKKTLTLKAKETQTVPFQVLVRKGTLTTHYPVHLDAIYGSEPLKKANICLVLETTFPSLATSKNPLRGQIVDDPKQLPLNVLPQRGSLALSALDTYRAFWYYDNKAERILPVGWQGNDEQSRAHLARNPIAANGESRQTLVMHPPYQGGIGNAGAEYRIQLPETKPLTLTFYSAVRTVAPPESPGDGVTFRVLADGKTIYEKHNAETVWVANEADLSDFAGKEILLRLESDPGAKRNTTCDSCYWGNVLLFAGEKNPVLSADEKQKLFEANLVALKTGKVADEKTVLKSLDGGLTAAVTFGNNGFIDGVIGLGNAEKQVQFDGIKIWCRGQGIGQQDSALSAGRWISKDETLSDAPPKPAVKNTVKNTVKNAAKNTAKNTGFKEEQELLWAQDITVNGETETLFFALRRKGPAIQFDVDASNPEILERIEFGAATQHAERVYFGHGYCVSEPEEFTVSAGGHTLSTSHVGMDFSNGLSVLQGSSFPVDRFVVVPQRKLYTLSVHPSTTLTLLPGLNGALDCAVRYRPITGNIPSSGFESKAGRFVFDIWGSKYAEHTETLRQAVAYGLTDSLFIVHNWQRWGYDNRLPDIVPPNPQLGTLAQMQEALEFCNKNGIQYGLHDNYIDFYPDAEGYNLDVTTFDENGQPRKAWNNYGIEAQSYQFRPDKVEKFLNRNLDFLTEHLPVSSYFIDVFTSIPPIDYYDRDGKFHSRAESHRHWAQTFDTVRTRLSKANSAFESATASSEAGMDSLIGHLDGADCQFMLLSDEPGEFRIPIKCKEWSRVPWFDAVHHNTFSLHGAGYSSRYEAQRGRLLHGIDSDDYITSEIITGHALMTDGQSANARSVRNAVRKYWLAQDLVRHLADKHIVSVQFDGGDIHRLIVTWNDKTKIHVNTGTDDWNVGNSLILPPFGFHALVPREPDDVTIPSKIEAGIYKRNGKIYEQSETYYDDKKIVYVNGRQSGIKNLCPVTPKLDSFQYLGGNQIQVELAWNTKGKIAEDWSIFVHCVEKRQNWHHRPKEAFLSGGGYPQTPASQWKGTFKSGQYTMTVPDDLPAGRYYLVAGLYDAKGNGRRAKLMGLDTGDDRYAVCWLNIKRKVDNSIADITTEPVRWDDEELFERLVPNTEPSQVDFVKSTAAFRLEIPRSNAEVETNPLPLILTPLPDEPAAEVTVRSGGNKVFALDASGKELREVPSQTESGLFLHFSTKEGDFAYKITWEL